jgi:hypothetical protein
LGTITVLTIDWLEGCASSCVKQLASHAGLTNRHSHPSLKFTTSLTLLQVRLGRDNDLLLPVVGCLTFTQIFSLLSSSVLVTLIQILNNGGVKLLHFLLKRRQTLNPIKGVNNQTWKELNERQI